MYFLCGCGLSIFVVIASSRVKNVENAPIQGVFQESRRRFIAHGHGCTCRTPRGGNGFSRLLVSGPGRITSAVLQSFGMKSSSAIRTGVAASILMTGALFGLMHAPQLGYTWGLVSLLTLVGVIFTFARAWTGTVLASFLLHLG